MNLNDRLKQLKTTSANNIKFVRYDGYIFAILMFLSILGVAITDASERMSHWYWLAMVPVFFGACLYLEWQNSLESGVPTKTIVLKQIQHWLGLLAGIYMTFFLREIGSLDNQTTGLILLLLLALTTFLAGVSPWAGCFVCWASFWALALSLLPTRNIIWALLLAFLYLC